MKSRTPADRLDTWDPDWEMKLTEHVHALGQPDVWAYVRTRPGLTYRQLAEGLAQTGSFGVAPIQVERLQVRDTPAGDEPASLRDSLARHLRHTFGSFRWKQGPYWESRALGALGSWSAMWQGRAELEDAKHRLFQLGTPEKWLPEDGEDAFLLELLPDR